MAAITKKFDDFLFEADTYAVLVKKWANNNKNKNDVQLDALVTNARRKIPGLQKLLDKTGDDKEKRAMTQKLIDAQTLIIDGVAYIRSGIAAVPKKA